MRIALFMLVLMFGARSAHGQSEGAPVLIPGPSIVYPPIAKAAHVTGEVVVRFTIEDDGTTSSVNVLSGPLMLQGAVADRTKAWRFKTPLPLNAERDFEASYRFGVDAPDESGDDDLDEPPYFPCCGDIIVLPPGVSKVEGKVRSINGSQSIDLTYAPPAPAPDHCPHEKEKSVPEESATNDYAELFRSCRKNCRDYKVRVYRDGRVEWLGRDEVAVSGWVQTTVSEDAASKLIEKFRTPAFWATCSAEPPSLDDDRDDENFISSNFLSVKIRDHVKTVATGYAGNPFELLQWAIERTANTHPFIHGDAAHESFLNMADDISMPKPGMTSLIRATYHFSHSSGQMTTDALKRLLGAPNVDVDAPDESGWTALMYAAELTADDREIGMLLDAHANANRASLHGDTPLMMAAYNGRLSRRLLKAGADINTSNADGVTTLMLLAQHMSAGELKDAIAAGADATAKDAQGRTTLDYLRAAACGKAIVPLPQPWMTIIYKEPLPCPSATEGYKESEAVLKAALKRTKIPEI